MFLLENAGFQRNREAKKICLDSFFSQSKINYKPNANKVILPKPETKTVNENTSLFKPLSDTSLFTFFDREKFGNVSSVCSTFISAASTSFPSFHATPKPHTTTISSSVSLPATLSSNKISQINKSKTDNLKLSVSEELLPSKYDSTDVAFYKNRINDMSEKEIFQMVKNTFSPSKQFVFPKTGKRHFRLSWLEDYSWLCSKHQWGILFTMCDFIDNICHFHHRIQNFSQRFWHMSCKLVYYYYSLIFTSR